MHLSSGELRRALAKLVRSCAELRRTGFWVAMGSYGHVKSSYTVWGHLGPFASSGEASPELAGAVPELAGAGMHEHKTDSPHLSKACWPK